MKKSKTKMILSIAVLAAMLLPQGLAVASSFDTVQAYGMDTVAGTQTKLRTSGTMPFQEVVFTLKKPDKQNIFLPAKTDANGIAKIDLSDFHTRKAGLYQVEAKLQNNNITGEATTFVVHPNMLSTEKSTVVADKLIANSDNNDEITLTVTDLDQYGNGLKNHFIQVISSRSSDNIKSDNMAAITQENGKAVFKISSNKPGLSAFSAVDMTAGAILNQRINAAFMDRASFLSDVGGDAASFVEIARAATASSADATATVTVLHHFDITSLPENIQPNQSVNFTITAKDESGKTVQNYTGKVHFSSEGSNSANVALPEDYSFKAEDLGTHQFSLGLTFKAAGSYKMVATDLNNLLIKGTKDVVVGATASGGASQQTSSSKPVIDTPVAGAYSQKTQTVSGKAQVGATVKIYDNQLEIGSVTAGSDGKFTFQSPTLTDGEHNIYVVIVDSAQAVKATSTTVKFSIDTTPPTVDSIELDPGDTVKAGQSLKIKVTSEEKLAQAALVFNSDIAQLTAMIDQPTVYTATVSAPTTPGVYPMDIILVDQLGNEGSYKAKTQVTVGDNAGGDSTAKSQSKQAKGGGTQGSKISGVIAYPSDKRITLVWDAASDNLAAKHYRVYYGVNANNLDKRLDTKDASTTWYVPNLDNGKTYYFAVTGVNSEEVESQSKSDVVSSAPFASEVSGFLSQGAGFGADGSTLHGAQFGQTVPPRSTDTGPEILLLVFPSLFLGAALQRSRKKTL